LVLLGLLDGASHVIKCDEQVMLVSEVSGKFDFELVEECGFLVVVEHSGAKLVSE
jgi:hypothetical protein